MDFGFCSLRIVNNTLHVSMALPLEILIPDMAVSVSVTEIGGGGWRLLCRPGINQYHWRLRLRLRVNSPNTPLFLQNPKSIHFTTTSTCPTRSSCVVPRALDPKTEDENSTTSFTFTSSASQEDLWYVAKLVVGSFVGAAAIKYGSALFPQITTPNLVLALFIIVTPVLVAIFLLIKQSRLNP